ncbi:sensor histidine kinase [Veronia pacifica]|uniref:histidine kinase n=1 Tax=Veronia pacifica TaxID=1080227 RepID=A0A1C3EKT5_9GAMM|nr:HAMP domain-containing sensor histidine kinase [Veronia pacifica]ODA33851.1 hypothetical protein A8L45_08465 [Veronia pacifica]
MESFVCVENNNPSLFAHSVEGTLGGRVYSDGSKPIALQTGQPDSNIFVVHSFAFWIWSFDLFLQLLCTLIVMGGFLSSWSNGLGRLEQLSRALSRGDLSKRVSLQGPAAIKSLIRNQHDMAESILRLQRKKKLIFGTLPHDIRTPLAAIQLTTDILSEHKGDNEFLTARLAGQVSKLNMICESSLHLYKILNNEVEVCKETLSLADILSDCHNLVAPGKPFNCINCHQQITSDKRLISILIQNILSNAFRYAGEVVTVTFKSYPSHEIISITDDGPGFSEDIVETFRKRDTSNINSTDGFGLGLLLIFELTKLLSGEVRIVNTGKGGQVLLAIEK